MKWNRIERFILFCSIPLDKAQNKAQFLFKRHNMASLIKRGKYYYALWQTGTGDEKIDIRKLLGIRYKHKAQEALQQLEDLEELGEINPFANSFNPKKVLKELNKKEEAVPVQTVR